MKTTPKQIKRIIEEITGLNLELKSRKGDLPYIRGMYFEISTRHTNESLASIGELTGKDHATVLHWRDNLEYRIRFDKRLTAMYNKLEEEIKYHIHKYNALACFVDQQAQDVIDKMAA